MKFLKIWLKVVSILGTAVAVGTGWFLLGDWIKANMGMYWLWAYATVTLGTVIAIFFYAIEKESAE